jgi:predicted dehydrogenase
MSTPCKILNIGLIGCGEVAQVIHIPTLSFMSAWFRVTYLCDVSPGALSHCASMLHGTAQTTRDPAELCSSPDVDAVLVASSDEYHAEHAILALQNEKNVLIEKPMAMCRRDAERIVDAETKSKGRVMVGYMRRYAAPFEDAVKEIGGLDKILYARVRDIIGRNYQFVAQSGTFPQQFSDFSNADKEDKKKRGQELVATAMREDCGGVVVNEETEAMWRLLGGLGSHDLSVMREVLGMPDGVVGASLGGPFWK